MKNVGVKCAVVLERGWRWTHVDFYLQTSGEMELDLSEASHHETSAAMKEKKKIQISPSHSSPPRQWSPWWNLLINTSWLEFRSKKEFNPSFKRSDINDGGKGALVGSCRPGRPVSLKAAV